MKNTDHYIIDTWQTSNRVTEFLFENMPEELWDLKIPGTPQKTIRMIAGHIHNARCTWIKMIGKRYGIKPPTSVDRRRVNRIALLAALKKSNQVMIQLLNKGLENEGVLDINMPWANIPSDVLHFMSYMIAHEAHHRGQIVLTARALGNRLTPKIINGLWQWRKFYKENGNPQKVKPKK
jgi:uncharacterized damage-inducible protein DinB